MKTVVWVHDECLNPQSAALRKYAGAPAVFVWDEAMLAEEEWSLKRIGFVYECLLELPVSIRRGRVAEEVRRFAREHGAERIAASGFVSPRLGRIARELGGVEVVEEPAFVEAGGRLDLRRFSRYWARVERRLGLAATGRSG
jgi:hypothetical protein